MTKSQLLEETEILIISDEIWYTFLYPDSTFQLGPLSKLFKNNYFFHSDLLIISSCFPQNKRQTYLHAVTMKCTQSKHPEYLSPLVVRAYLGSWQLYMFSGSTFLLSSRRISLTTNETRYSFFYIKQVLIHGKSVEMGTVAPPRQKKTKTRKLHI